MDTDKKITVRMPADLHERLVELADADTRSLNAEILVLLREAIERRALASRPNPDRP